MTVRPIPAPLSPIDDHRTWYPWFKSIQSALTGGMPFQLQSHAKADLPSASPEGQMIYVTDETGGAVPAFSDGTNWRRVTDRAVVS